jgi:hypothetical protein
MCLHTITKTYDPLDPKERVAWKIFYKRNGNLEGLFKFCKPTTEWQTAEKIIIKANSLKGYTTGFHCYKSRDDARKILKYLRTTYKSLYDKCTIVKIVIRNVTYEGTDGIDAVEEVHKIVNIVAQEMKLWQKTTVL